MSRRKPFRVSIAWVFVLPSLMGMAVFFFIPGVGTLVYALTNNRGDFVFLANFANLVGDMAFRLGATNSLRFIAVSVPLNMLISFILASLLQNLTQKKLLSVFFMLPMIIPSGSVVFFWNVLFADNGAINSLLFRAGMSTVPWLASDWAFYVVVLVFLQRNIGFNMVLFLSGYQFIPKDYYEMAKMEGAGAFATLRRVTLIYMMPTMFIVFMMSIINSFRIFREIYLLYGQYPHRSVYMLQHFMNNQFLFANMQRLSVTATAISAVTVVLVWGIFTGQRKMSDNF